ncbi:uncharacterized protein UBRO_20812 [Ustilago bromivora]|uniref:Uncharacterized protein n=1 Tax=Ustilago bromivora TaxID=307758 RepID=A0A1K0G8M8_9BASI|nr:uncharacterized protein UBRO_20812 [Ustilago bromivora]SYW79756.1 uncharacterized protein UBRO2_03175 [Ustilago bromivora]
MQPKERSVGPTDSRTEEAKHSIWALHPANFGDHEGGPKPEGIGLGCWEEEYGVVSLPRDGPDQQLSWRQLVPGNLAASKETGEGDSKGCGDDLMVPGTKRHGPELLEDGPKKGEGDGELGRSWSKAMCVLDASNHLFQPAIVKG